MTKAIAPFTMRHKYYFADGTLHHVQYRTDLPTGKRCWKEPAGVEGRYQIFGSHDVIAGADSMETVFIVEGEKCVDALAGIGLVATTSGGATSAHAADWTPLQRFAKIVILPDADDPGRKYAADVVSILADLPGSREVRICALPSLEPKQDIVNWMEQHDSLEPDALRRLLLQEIKAHSVPATIATAEPESSTNDDGARLRLVERLSQAVRTNSAPGRKAALDSLVALECEFDPAPFVPRTARDLLSNPPSPDKVLVHGLLIRGGVWCIAGQSKAGKSCALLQAAITLAGGGLLFGKYRCEPSKILLIDIESTPSLLTNKLRSTLDFCRFKRWVPDSDNFLDNLSVLTLCDSLEPVTTEMIQYVCQTEMAAHGAADLVIVDPLYLISTDRAGADENAASDTTRLLSGLKAAAMELGAGLAYSHHFAKGNPGAKEAMDRPSGSGVHARLAFCLSTLSPLEEGQGVLLESITRGWRAPEPETLRFNWPCFEIDQTLSSKLKAAPGRPSKVDEHDVIRIVQTQGTYDAQGMVALHLRDLADTMKCSERTARRYVDSAGLAIKAGFVLAPEPVSTSENEEEIPFD